MGGERMMRLALNVFPDVSVDHVSNRRLRDSELSSKFVVGSASLGTDRTNCKNVISGKDRWGSSLHDLVCDIVRVGAKKQMRRVRARRVVAPVKNTRAVMILSFRDRPVVQLPRDMGRIHDALIAKHPSVSFSVSATFPRPAIVRKHPFLHVRPKPLFKAPPYPGRCESAVSSKLVVMVGAKTMGVVSTSTTRKTACTFGFHDKKSTLTAPTKQVLFSGRPGWRV